MKTHIKHVHQGRGSLEFLPEKYTKYFLEVFRTENDAEGIEFELPKTDNSQIYSLTIEGNKQKSIGLGSKLHLYLLGSERAEKLDMSIELLNKDK